MQYHIQKMQRKQLDNIPIDIISINIKEIIEDLSKITGENVTEDVIKEIFSKFCLGKWLKNRRRDKIWVITQEIMK